MITPKLALALVCTLLCIACEKKNESQKNTFTDTRNGKIYKTTKIGEQVWLAENLDYNVGRNKCCNNETANCDKYGRLYNWETAMKACPNGWHLPTNEEWDVLYRYADGTSSKSSPYDSETAGKFLKATSGWNRYEGKSGNGEDKFGFSALPGGFGDSDDCFNVGNNGIWWSSSEENSKYAYGRLMDYGGDYAQYSDHYLKSYLRSVRCLQD